MTLPSSTIANGLTPQTRRDLVELELKRLLQEASAARLEAEAARLQVLLARIDRGETISDQEWSTLNLTETRENVTESQPPSMPVTTSPAASPGGHYSGRFSSWEQVRSAQVRSATLRSETTATPASTSLTEPLDWPVADSPLAKTTARSTSPTADPVVPPVPLRRSGEGLGGRSNGITTAPKPDAKSKNSDTESSGDRRYKVYSSSTNPSRPAAPVVIETLPDDAESGPKRRPAAFVVSTLVHIVAILLLAMVTLNTTLPKDQLSFSASAASGEESAMETFSIEAPDPVTDPVESAPAETAYDLSPMGTMAAVEITSEVIGEGNSLSDSLSMLSSSSASSSALRSLASSGKSAPKMEFCGVEGGGNHFVYLVDSSGSMGDAFVSARAALLQSIDLLTPQQRFYVVFFDADCDFMRISDPNVDEPTSVYATDENKQKLRNWAMRIAMDRGKAPYDPLRFALGLRPDVIFLLSDGEFPQGIEDLLKEENVVTNLFGDSHPISIVHTIGYHSQEGESRMKRIASQNQGQYRHIPKP